MDGYTITGKKRIRSLGNNLPNVFEGKTLCLAVELRTNLLKAQRVGFGDNPAIGDTVLPKIIGPATKLNAYGKDIIRRDQEKETIYRTQEWTHEEWAGRGETRTVTTEVDVPYRRYPRDHEDGPELELSVRAGANGALMVALEKPVRYINTNTSDLITAVNLFLEIFGYVEIFDEGMTPMRMPASVRHLNWVVLPKGERISETALKVALSASKRTRPVEMARQEKINDYGPSEIAVGIAGFSGYIIYVFPKRRLAVLESLRYGNATYFLKNSRWEELSKLTKKDLLSNRLVESRIIHTKAWQVQIDNILRGEP